MKNSLSLAAQLFCILAACTLSAAAQPLPQVHLKQVFPNLKLDARPVWISEAPDGSGRFFIVEQTGTIYVLKKNSDGSDAKEFLNIQDRKPMVGNEDGLLSIAFHPGFKTNSLFYIYYNQKNSQADIDRLKGPLPVAFPFRSVVSEFKVSATDPDKADMSSERVVLEVLQPFSNHKGGELAFGPDGYLYLALGDGGLGDDPFGNGQSTATLLAKILRIDVNTRATLGSGRSRREFQYGFPPDNPFIKEPDMGGRGARKEIWAYGLRNVWRYSWDRKTGAMWAGDVGQDLWEEVDLIVKGGNYGWSIREGAHHFKPGPEGAQYIEPVMEYPHHPNLLPESLFPNHTVGLCVVGGYVYRGKQFPALEGVYIYGDYNLGTIWGMRYDYDAKKVVADGTLLLQPKNITSFAEDNDGEIYMMTEDGKFYQITTP